MAGKNVIELTDANFEAEVLKSNVPVLVDFTATCTARTSAFSSGDCTAGRSRIETPRALSKNGSHARQTRLTKRTRPLMPSSVQSLVSSGGVTQSKKRRIASTPLRSAVSSMPMTLPRDFDIFSPFESTMP